MSIIAEFKALEAQIAEQQKRLEALKDDEKLKKSWSSKAKFAHCLLSTATRCVTSSRCLIRLPAKLLLLP